MLHPAAGGAGSTIYAAEVGVDVKSLYYDATGGSAGALEMIEYSILSANIVYLRDGGIALSSGLRALLGAFGVDLPSAGLALELRTIVVTVLVGVLVTVVAAVVPAWKSGRVPPVAAMRDDVIVTSKPSRSRLVFGGILGAAGLGAVLYGLSAERLEMLGLGTVALFFSLFVLGPLLARPVARGLGAPIAALTGITGQMARQNTARNPKRTARTAFALLFGVALVTGVTPEC